jgi:hypothetical protein
MPPEPKLMETVVKHSEKLANIGILLGTEGLWPFSKGARVQSRGWRQDANHANTIGWSGT